MLELDNYRTISSSTTGSATHSSPVQFHSLSVNLPVIPLCGRHLWTSPKNILLQKSICFFFILLFLQKNKIYFRLVHWQMVSDQICGEFMANNGNKRQLFTMPKSSISIECGQEWIFYTDQKFVRQSIITN